MAVNSDPDSEVGVQLTDPLRDAFEAAEEVSEVSPHDAEEAFLRILTDAARSDEAAVKIRENCVYRLAKLYVTGREFSKVLSLLESANPLFSGIAKVGVKSHFV